MSKFFVPKENIFDDKIFITGGDVAHILKVLRMKKNDKLCLCDGKGIDYEASIFEVSNDKIVCEILSQKKSDTEANIEVTLFQGIPKASKMDYIIQKTTELGIVRIVPCEMTRCVSKLDKKDAVKKCERWQKISEEAAKQSGRGVIPEVHAPVTFDEAINLMKQSDLCFAPFECEEQTTLKSILTQKSDVKTVSYIIGPEGGFDMDEVEKLKNNGVKTVTLGKRILRTETAGEAVLSMVMYELGDINKLCGGEEK